VGVVVAVRAAVLEAEQAAAVARGQVLLALQAYGNRSGVVEQEVVAPVVVAGVVEEGREAEAPVVVAAVVEEGQEAEAPVVVAAVVEEGREAVALAAGVVSAPEAVAELAAGAELVAVE
jgi:hypothetical protein